jgi:hypothetical protein
MNDVASWSGPRRRATPARLVSSCDASHQKGKLGDHRPKPDPRASPMPSTLFHIPPNALVAWPLRRHLDVPMVLLANLAMDVEPFIGSLLDRQPPHGPFHSLLGGALVGAFAGWLWWRVRRPVGRILRGEYALTRSAAVVSGVVGAWLHVLLDAVMYDHLRPFLPLATNPLYIPGSGDALHVVAAAVILPALVIVWRSRDRGTVHGKLTLALLAASAVGMLVAVATGAAP